MTESILLQNNENETELDLYDEAEDTNTQTMIQNRFARVKLITTKF